MMMATTMMMMVMTMMMALDESGGLVFEREAARADIVALLKICGSIIKICGSTQDLCKLGCGGQRAGARYLSPW